MEQLEFRVREALIRQRADRLYEYAMTSPVYKEHAETLLGGLEDYANALLKDAPSEDMQIMKRAIVSRAREGFFNPQKVMEAMLKTARNQYTSHEDVVRATELMITTIKSMDMMPEDLERVKRVSAGLAKYTKTNDRVVREITQIAERKGVERAIKDESAYRAIRKIFPARKDYERYCASAIGYAKKIISAFMPAAWGEDEKTLDTEFSEGGFIKKLGETAIKLLEKIQEDWVQQEADRIYGRRKSRNKGAGRKK